MRTTPTVPPRSEEAADRPLAFTRHDHDVCRDAALAEARRLCAERGLRLTPARERTLEILLESHAALGAYDILARLREEGLGAQPPIAYRALDFLVENGFAHRIEKLNAFVACAHPGRGHDPAFLICRDCGKIAEAVADAIAAPIDADAARLGFDIERRVIEAEGLCPGCRQRSPA
jgi:Fur family transcriptional regulator, zinc uptake regulator